MELILGMIGLIIVFNLFTNSQGKKSSKSSQINRARELHNKSMPYSGRVSRKDVNEYVISRAEDERKIRKRKSETMGPLWFFLILIVIVVLMTKAGF